ncbi:hypothetical protein BGZ49_005682 [Haplosporangium sp. Z 27]|nr:hypothetical protein BGZ49_005682 [Haplosporangium sp. Z 27]
MSSYKRPTYFPLQPQQQGEKPWLKYPDPEKSSNVHSRTYTPTSLTKSQELTLSRPSLHASRSETQPVGLHHKRSSSKLHSGNSSNASLPMSLTGSNSSSDSLSYHSHSQLLRSSSSSSSKQRSLSDELSSAFQKNSSNASIDSKSTIIYTSPITPSDLLGIPDPSSASSSSVSSSTTLAPSESPVQKADSTSHKLRPSPLSIDTTLSNNTFEGTAFAFPQGSPMSVRGSTTNSEGLGSPRVNAAPISDHNTPSLPRLSHSSSHSSSASSSSYSNPSSPSSVTPPCSSLCQHHTKSHSHSHSHQPHHHHHSCSHHKHERHHRHHPSCHHHGSSHRHSSRSDRVVRSSSRYGVPQLDEHVEELIMSPVEEAQNDNPKNEMSLGIEVPPSSTTTAVTIVGSTPAFGIGSFREQDGQEHNALGLYSVEPPKKRQRSTAAVLVGAALETVIFTSAVALSAYQLLTGRGKQQLEDAAMTSATDETTMSVPESNGELRTERSLVATKSVPVNIPGRGSRHRDSSLLGKSLHHNHHVRSHHHKSKHSGKSRHGLSSSLPHAYDYDHMKEAMTMPERPNTGTEDSDEQFLRMEAQLTTLIAEGKRALSSRIPDWNEA